MERRTAAHRDRRYRGRTAASSRVGSGAGGLHAEVGPNAVGVWMMKLLVTGGTGFIGSRLALAARALGHTVVVAGQLNTDAERARARELDRGGVAIEQGPLQDAD